MQKRVPDRNKNHARGGHRCGRYQRHLSGEYDKPLWAASSGGHSGRPHRKRPEKSGAIRHKSLYGISAVIQLSDGICGTFHIDTDSNAADRAFFAVYGTKGIVYLTDPNQFGGTVRFLPNTLDFRKPQEPVELWNFSQYGDSCRGIGPAEMADAILGGRKNRASKEMACHVLEVLTAILRGGERGTFVDVTSSCDVPAPMKPKSTEVKNLGHVAFQAKDMDAMLHFYGDILGMKRHFTLTAGNFEDSLRRQNGGQIQPDAENYLRQPGPDRDRPWIVYLKFADDQFI